MSRRDALIAPGCVQQSQCPWVDKHGNVAVHVDIYEVECRLLAAEIVVLGNSHRSVEGLLVLAHLRSPGLRPDVLGKNHRWSFKQRLNCHCIP